MHGWGMGGELGGGFMLLGRVDGTSSCGEYGVGEEWWWVRDVQSELTIFPILIAFIDQLGLEFEFEVRSV